MISLLSENILVAENDMRCDALSIWLDVGKNIDVKEKMKVIRLVFDARKGITKGTQYSHYEFLDDETGEIQEMNCRVDMDLMMRRNNFYPKIIAQILYS